MAQIARDVENGVPPDPLNPHARVPSSYHHALDTVRTHHDRLLSSRLTVPIWMPIGTACRDIPWDCGFPGQT